MNLSNKTDFVIIGAIIGMLTIGGTLIFPALRDIVALKHQITTQREKLERERRAGKTLAQTIADFQSIKDDVHVLDTTLLELGHELNFITDMEKLASEYALELTLKFDTGTVDKTRKPPYPVATTFTLEGRYLPILAFLNRIERLPYYVTFTNIRISQVKLRTPSSQFNVPSASETPPTNTETDNALKAEISAITYWK